MMTTTVLVICDHSDDEDFCEAEFEVIRDSFPADMQAIVDRQLKLRGWSGSIQDRVICPLHVREGER